MVQAAAATGLPTVLVTPSSSAPAATTNAAARLALPALRAGETGQVTLSGFAAQQPVALEMTPRCGLGAAAAGRDAGVAVGGFAPGSSNASGSGEVRSV